jgi:hypothetical protein
VLEEVRPSERVEIFGLDGYLTSREKEKAKERRRKEKISKEQNTKRTGERESEREQEKEQTCGIIRTVDNL